MESQGRGLWCKKMKESELLKLNKLIEEGTPEKFYDWRVWRRLRKDVLKLDNFECQHCKAKGRYRKGYIVHHIKHLVDRPDLALSIFDGEERQLITLCKDCHEEEHPESLKQFETKEKEIVTEERWD